MTCCLIYAKTSPIKWSDFEQLLISYKIVRVCLCAYVCVCVYGYVCVSKCAFMCVRMCECLRVWMCMFVCMCECVYVFACLCGCICLFKNTCPCVFIVNQPRNRPTYLKNINFDLLWRNKEFLSQLKQQRLGRATCTIRATNNWLIIPARN